MRFARNFVRRRKIRPEWGLNAKNYEFDNLRWWTALHRNVTNADATIGVTVSPVYNVVYKSSRKAYCCGIYCPSSTSTTTSVRPTNNIHTYIFVITQNDRTHLHKIKIQVKKTTNKSSRVKTVIKLLIRVFEQHAVNKIPFAQLTGDNT